MQANQIHPEAQGSHRLCGRGGCSLQKVVNVTHVVNGTHFVVKCSKRDSFFLYNILLHATTFYNILPQRNGHDDLRVIQLFVTIGFRAWETFTHVRPHSDVRSYCPGRM